MALHSVASQYKPH